MGRGGGTTHFDMMLMRPWLLSLSPGRKRGGSWVPGFLCSWLGLNTLTSPYSLESCFCLLLRSQSLTRNIASATSENCLSNIREGIAVKIASFQFLGPSVLLRETLFWYCSWFQLVGCLQTVHSFLWLQASRNLIQKLETFPIVSWMLKGNKS